MGLAKEIAFIAFIVAGICTSIFVASNRYRHEQNRDAILLDVRNKINKLWENLK